MDEILWKSTLTSLTIFYSLAALTVLVNNNTNLMASQKKVQTLRWCSSNNKCKSGLENRSNLPVLTGLSPVWDHSQMFGTHFIAWHRMNTENRIEVALSNQQSVWGHHQSYPPRLQWISEWVVFLSVESGLEMQYLGTVEVWQPESV